MTETLDNLITLLDIPSDIDINNVDHLDWLAHNLHHSNGNRPECWAALWQVNRRLRCLHVTINELDTCSDCGMQL